MHFRMKANAFFFVKMVDLNFQIDLYSKIVLKR